MRLRHYLYIIYANSFETVTYFSFSVLVLPFSADELSTEDDAGSEVPAADDVPDTEEADVSVDPDALLSADEELSDAEAADDASDDTAVTEYICMESAPSDDELLT